MSFYNWNFYYWNSKEAWDALVIFAVVGLLWTGAGTIMGVIRLRQHIKADESPPLPYPHGSAPPIDGDARGAPRDNEGVPNFAAMPAPERRDYVAAQNNLGDGLGGLSKDDREAARLFKLAADQGYARAQSSLAFFYESGRGGLPKDEHEAIRLYKLAADQGNSNAQAALKRLAP
jgi:hypothetical protein